MSYHEWYDAKHSKPTSNEIKLINSIDIEYCPYCGSINIVKDGHYRNGTQEYL